MVIQGHSRSKQKREGLHIYIQYLISKVSKNTASKNTENCHFQESHCCLMPLSKEISLFAKTLYYQKLDSLCYTFAANMMGRSAFTFSWWAPKIYAFWNGVDNGCSRSFNLFDFGTNRKHVCNFLLVINSNLGIILPHFRNTASFLLTTATSLLFYINFGVLLLDWTTNVGDPRNKDPEAVGTCKIKHLQKCFKTFCKCFSMYNTYWRQAVVTCKTPLPALFHWSRV